MCSIHYLTNNSFTDWRFVDLLYLAHLDSPADYSYNNKFGIYVMWRKTSEQFVYLNTQVSIPISSACHLQINGSWKVFFCILKTKSHR